MRKILVIFILFFSNILYSEDMTISFIHRKFDPLLNTTKINKKLRASESEGENYYLLQFNGPIYQNWKIKIKEEGGIFHSYIPHFAYIVQMTPQEKNKIEKFPFVRWIGLFHPEYKIHPSVYKKRSPETEVKLPTINAVIEDNRVKIIKKRQCNCGTDALWIKNDPLLHLSIRFFKGTSLESITHKLQEWGSDIQQIQKSCNRMIVRIPPDSLNALANLREIQSIVPYSKKVLSSSTWRYSVQVPMDSFTIAQDEEPLDNPPYPIMDTVTSGITLADKGITGKGEIITIFDSGLDYWSAFFQDPENDLPGPSHIAIEAYTAEGGDLEEVSSPNDPGGCTHGTNVATITAGDLSIADNHPNGGNLMHYYDWGGQTRGNVLDYFPVRLYVQDFGKTEGDSCKLGSFDFPAAMDRAYNTYNSKIHQNSWNYDNYEYEGEYIAEAIDVDNMAWNNKDFVVVVSAGNRGPAENTVMSPATAKNCISVGSSWVPSFDCSPDSITDFSSRGWTSDGRIKPDVVAPGGTDPFKEKRHYVWGAMANTIWAGDSAHTNLLGMGGTSQATPHISAACAMIRQYFKDGFHPTGDTLTGISFEPSAALVKTTLIASTEATGTNPVPNRAEGWGRVVLDNALYFANESRVLAVSDNETGVSTDDTVINTVNIENSAEPLKFVLAWSDTAAAATAGPKLVNDLDLTVTAPDGTKYLGNVFSGGFSEEGGSPDRLNNVEVVWLSSPVQLGTYSISTNGHHVPSGSVPFAIAVVGGISGTISPPQNGKPEHEYFNIRSPFIEETEIQLILENTSNVKLTIYDILGRKIKTLINGTIEPAHDPVTWGEDVNPGLYFAVLEIDGKQVDEAKLLKISE